jgi:hypothetical protein
MYSDPQNRSLNQSLNGPAPSERGPAKKRANPEALRRERDELYEEARQDAASEAAEIVRALVRAGLSSAYDAYDDAPRLALGEERRRHERARRRRTQEEEAEARRAWEHTSELEQKIGEQQAMLEEVARAAADAKAAAESGREQDPTAVYERIAEIVGLRQPLKPYGPPPNEGAPD